MDMTNQMVISSREEDDCSEFEFSFDGANLGDNHYTQLLTNQQIETPKSISSGYVELGSSSGSDQLLINQANINQNFTGSAYTNHEPSNSPPESPSDLDLSQPAGTSSCNPLLEATLPANYLPRTGCKMNQITRASREPSDSPPESDSDLDLPKQGTSSFDPLLEAMLPAYRPTMDFMELGSSSGNYQSRLSTQSNSNTNLSQPAHISCESSDYPVINDPQNLLPIETSSFNSPLIDAPQLYSPTVEYVDPARSLGESNQPSLNHANSYQNLLQFAYFSSEPRSVDPPNARQMGTSFFNPPFSGTPQPNPSTTELITPGVEESFNPDDEVNLIHPNQPISLPCTTSSLDQPVQNIANNYLISNNNQQVSCYPTSFPLNAMGVVNSSSSLLNQQRPSWPSNSQNTPSYRPSTTQLRPQLLSDPLLNQALMNTANVNSMLPKVSATSSFLRPHWFPGPRQHLNQVTMRPNVFNPQHRSMLPGSSVPFRPQHQCYPHQLNQVPMVPNVYDPQGFTSMLRPQLPTLPRPLPLKIPDYYQPLNHVRMAPNAINSLSQNSKLPECSMLSRSQQLSVRPQLLSQVMMSPNMFDQQGYTSKQPESFKLSRPQRLVGHSRQLNQVSVNSMQREPSMLSRPQQLYNHHRHQLNQVQMRPINAFDSQCCNSMLLNPAVDVSRPQEVQQQGLLNQNSGPSHSDSSHGNSELNQFLNSVAQKEIGDQNIGAKTPHQLEGSCCNDNEQGLMQQEQGTHASNNQCELGESSSSHSRGEVIRPKLTPPMLILNPEQVMNTINAQSRGKEAQNFNVPIPSISRPIRNSLYDPVYESVNLPVDPHLRLFVARDFHANKKARLDDQSWSSGGS